MKSRARSKEEYLQYRIRLFNDKETGVVVADVPALGIADQGRTPTQALSRVQKMIAFHLDCLREEGQQIPVEKEAGQGFYIRVKCPTRATKAA